MATAPPAGIPRRNTIWDLIGRDQDSQLEPSTLRSRMQKLEIERPGKF
jgi:hypothetical protein